MNVITELWGVARVQPDGSLTHIDVGQLGMDRTSAQTVRVLIADDHPDGQYVITRQEVLPPREIGVDDAPDPLHDEVTAAILAEWQKLADDNTTGEPPEFAHLFATAALNAIRSEHHA